MGLSGKVCVITGASSGIGRQTALDLADDGASVVVAARREDRLVSLVAEMAPGDHSYVVADVSDRAQVRSLARHTEARHGRCDVLINNAGISTNVRLDGPDGVAEVERIFATNFFGVVYCIGEFMPLLERSAPAHIVNVASVSGRIATPGVGAYAASKFAVVGLSESLYYDLAPRGIHVSCIEPGFIPTEGFPQEDIKRDRVLRFTLGSAEGVSKAIRDAIAHRKMQRTEPRWYYLLQFLRIGAPPLFRALMRRTVAPRQKKRAEED